MSHELLTVLNGQILADLARSGSIRASSSTNDRKGKRGKSPMPAQHPDGENMDARLRSIRRYITPRELAALLHWDLATVYRRIKAGMPVDRDVDSQGREGRIQIYPPQIAAWLRRRREKLRQPNRVPSGSPGGGRGGSKAERVVEIPR
jgi:hypothetical protein